MNLGSSICQFVLKINQDKLPLIVLHRAKRAFLDSMGCLIAGINETPIHLLREFDQRFYPRVLSDSFPIFGTSDRTTLFQAAYINGSAMHVLDFEPLWHPPTHPCSPILGALLSACYLTKTTLSHFLAAFIVGLELEARLGLLRKNYNVPLLFHPPGVEGIMGAALATAYLFHLNEKQMLYSLGIAASRASGIMANVGTMTKCTHCGHGARMGLEASLLAQTGLEAQTDIFNHFSGYIAVFGDQDNLEKLKLAEAFGYPFWLENHDMGFKWYPAQFSLQFAIEAALSLANRVPIHDIHTIIIQWPQLKYLDRPVIQQSVEAKFSLQYVVACALLRKRVSHEDFTHENIQEQEIQDVMRKIVIEFDTSIPSNFDTLYGRIIIKSGEGKQYEQYCGFPKGHWHNPANDTQIINKFIYNTEGFFDTASAYSLALQILDPRMNQSMKHILKNFIKKS